MLSLSAAPPSTHSQKRHTTPKESALPVSTAALVTMSPSNSKSTAIPQLDAYLKAFFSLWNVKEAIATIKDTYEINENLESYNYRAGVLFRDIREQTQRFACSGAIYTQTTDVEGEVNGLVTYDRRFLRPHLEQWQADIQSVYRAAASRGGRKLGAELGDILSGQF